MESAFSLENRKTFYFVWGLRQMGRFLCTLKTYGLKCPKKLKINRNRFFRKFYAHDNLSGKPYIVMIMYQGQLNKTDVETLSSIS